MRNAIHLNEQHYYERVDMTEPASCLWQFLWRSNNRERIMRILVLYISLYITINSNESSMTIPHHPLMRITIRLNEQHYHDREDMTILVSCLWQFFWKSNSYGRTMCIIVRHI
ncbi:hypothetical protein BDB00DRAFT_861395 [Zychaea mexicana]|uniref:uncharacterized protein n=1 Tax=Zychaea mexicana TaxID=64656 RepID=UPI0022FE9207|nr:uncharacterized protein BDB00DRAFT_861395 [Zychaea mexicana]KAI9472887.1 hypothetical protein BDB00DRAFT_861395 [Zychaea mexicana]